MKLNLLIIPVLFIAVSCTSSKKNTAAQPEAASYDLPINTEGGAEEVVTSVEAPSKRTSQQAIWERRALSALPNGEKRIEPKAYAAYTCAFDQLTADLDAGASSITLPTLAGMVTFTIQNSNTMSSSLAEKFPNIRSYKGASEDGGMRLRLDTNDEGLFAEISGTNNKELIAPLYQGDTRYYALYKEEDATGGTPRNSSYD